MNDVQLSVIHNEHWWQRPRYRLQEPVQISGHIVPAGFVTDGATVPRGIAVVAGLLALLGFWFDYDWPGAVALAVAVAVIYFPPVGKYLKAAIVHDWLLEGCPGGGVVRASLVGELRGLGAYGRRKCIDREFELIMQDLQIARWRRRIMHTAVRLNSMKVWLLRRAAHLVRKAGVTKV